MKIKELFKPTEELNIYTYLSKCGVEDPKEYIDPSPLLCDSPNKYNYIQDGVDMLYKHILANDHIYILQDSDCDGLCSAALAYMFLRRQDCINLHILSHELRTHGLTWKIMDTLRKSTPGLLWIPDAGSNDYKECDELLNLGWDILITDHHDIEKVEYVPSKVVLINNQYKDQDLNSTNGSGTHVTYKLIQYYLSQHHQKPSGIMADMVMLANVGDVMDMRSYENRYLNLKRMGSIVHPFIKAMCDTFITGDINSISLGWNVVPKINATLRGDDMELKARLFQCMALEIDEYNDVIKEMKAAHRKQSDFVKKEAEKLLDKCDPYDKVCIINSEESGAYSGLIANNLLSSLGKPILLVHEKDGVYKGSARSPMEFKNICQQSGLFNLAQGHGEAFGIEFDACNLYDIRHYFNELDLDIDPEVEVTLDLNKSNLDPSYLIDLFDKYNDIWGTCIPKPQFYLKTIVDTKDIKSMGANGTTIKFQHNGLDCIKFFVSKAKKEQWGFNNDGKLEVQMVGSLSYNEWGGERTPQFEIDRLEVKPYEEKAITFDDIF